MPDFSVTLPDLDKFQKKMMQFPKIAEKNMQDAIIKSSAEVMKQATRRNVPWKTGNLVQSFGVVMGRLYASVGPDRSTPAAYAIYVHEGTRPHRITPKTAKALYFGGKFSKGVNHPGTKPNPFMPRILEAAKVGVESQWKKALDKITQEINAF